VSKGIVFLEPEVLLSRLKKFNCFKGRPKPVFHKDEESVEDVPSGIEEEESVGDVYPLIEDKFLVGTEEVNLIIEYHYSDQKQCLLLLLEGVGRHSFGFKKELFEEMKEVMAEEEGETVDPIIENEYKDGLKKAYSLCWGPDVYEKCCGLLLDKFVENKRSSVLNLIVDNKS
jgi:hypothetical protein